MTVQRRTIGDGVVGPEKLAKSFREARYGFEPFSQQPFSFTLTDGFGDPTGTTGNQNGFNTGFNNFVWFVKGTQTLLVPVFTTDGFYNFALDQTLNDGWELLVGGNNTVTTGGNQPAHYTVGTDEFFVRLLFSAENVSGVNLLAGVRKVEAFQADFNDYDELAGLQVLGDSSSAAAVINAVNILNNAATNTDDTGDTLADATDVELLVLVEGRSVKVRINGADPSQEVDAFTFDDGEVVTPFVNFLQTTDLSGELKLKRLEWGLLEDYNGVVLTTP